MFNPNAQVFSLDYNDSGTWDGPTTDRLRGPFGLATDRPVTDNRSGSTSGNAKIGTYRPSNQRFYLDLDNRGRRSGSTRRCRQVRRRTVDDIRFPVEKQSAMAAEETRGVAGSLP